MEMRQFISFRRNGNDNLPPICLQKTLGGGCPLATHSVLISLPSSPTISRGSFSKEGGSVHEELKLDGHFK